MSCFRRQMSLQCLTTVWTQCYVTTEYSALHEPCICHGLLPSSQHFEKVFPATLGCAAASCTRDSTLSTPSDHVVEPPFKSFKHGGFGLRGVRSYSMQMAIAHSRQAGNGEHPTSAEATALALHHITVLDGMKAVLTGESRGVRMSNSCSPCLHMHVRPVSLYFRNTCASPKATHKTKANNQILVHLVQTCMYNSQKSHGKKDPHAAMRAPRMTGTAMAVSFLPLLKPLPPVGPTPSAAAGGTFVS